MGYASQRGDPPIDAQLGQSEVHIWVVQLDDPDRQKRRLLAHASLNQILAQYLDVEPADLRFATLDYGKPVLASGELQFNLSHSGRVGVVAVSTTLPVGVDVQKPHSTVTKPWFKQRICTARELADLGARDPDPDAVLRLWVRKEAVIKACGTSVLRAGEIDVLEDRVDGGWLCLDLPIAECRGYRAAIATRAQPGVSVALKGRFSSAADLRR